MNSTEQFIYLAGCAMTGTTAALDEADFETLWGVASAHNLNALLAKALSATNAFKNADAEEQKRWKNALNNNIKKTMRFAAERKVIESFLESQGSWYVPLKGAIINGLYKSFGTREFADNDILYDESCTAALREFMAGRGYELDESDLIVDEFIKKPLYNFEMHRTFFDPKKEENHAYFDEMVNRHIKDEGKEYACHLSNEDFYIYFIAHAYKHYKYRGTGFRTVTDEYAILSSEKLLPDFAYVEKELKKLGADDFERQLRHLSEALFAHPERIEEVLTGLPADENEMLRFIMASGTFGSFETQIINDLEKSLKKGGKTKAKYYLNRIFPSIERFRLSHPFVYKHKVVYPFFLMYRMVVTPIKHRRTLKHELDTLKKIK